MGTQLIGTQKKLIGTQEGIDGNTNTSKLARLPNQA
jgi:hypothetical protein